MLGLFQSKLKEYQLPNGWKISFPEKWVNEYESYPEGDQYLFYPQDSDLIFRIASFCVEIEQSLGYISTVCRR